MTIQQASLLRIFPNKISRHDEARPRACDFMFARAGVFLQKVVLMRTGTLFEAGAWSLITGDWRRLWSVSDDEWCIHGLDTFFFLAHSSRGLCPQSNTRVTRGTFLFRISLALSTNFHDDLYRDHVCLAQRSFPFALFGWRVFAASLHVSGCLLRRLVVAVKGYKWEMSGNTRTIYGNTRKGDGVVV